MTSKYQVSTELMGKEKEEPMYKMRISEFAMKYQIGLKSRFLPP